MTNFQKAFCVLMSLCFFAVLALVPDPFFLQENVYRQLPLYCFLEKKAGSVPWREDPETYEKIIADNTAYLGLQVQKENGLLAPEEEKDDQKADNQSEPSGFGAEQLSGETGEAQKEQTAEKVDEHQTAEERNNQAQASEKEVNDARMEAEESGQPETAEKSNENGTETEHSGEADVTGEEEITTAARPEGMLEPHPVLDLSPESLADYDYLLGQFFILDSNTATNEEQLNAAQFLAEDLTIQQDAEKPQILIYHSHSQEAFEDSREGEVEDTIVGVGNYLTQLLSENYGYHVIHVTETFDIIDGEIDRSRAYDYAREYVEQVLEENPSIEVIIDLHRDGVPEDRRLVTEINGKDTAQIMFYNGLSYTVNNGPVDYLPNPYIQDNLAFSFQLEYQAALYYPELYRGIYLAGLRYNLHLRPKALLLEAGAQTNTVQEVKNAMEPFADILDRVLRG
ncbi:MAG: stage II sporulation protein P [Eubacteriales bacterium]|nr:stage II sporulation protein P [Eubacteriales bacterium]